MSITLNNMNFSNFKTGMTIGRGVDINIFGTTVNDCRDGVVFESELGTNAQFRGNEMVRCSRGLVIGEKVYSPSGQKGFGHFKLSPVAIIVRRYLAI